MLETLISFFKDDMLSAINKISELAKYQWFKINNNKSPLTEEEAKNHAYGVLSGNIRKVISFNNIDENNIYILVYLRENIEKPLFKLVLLKQIGNSYSIDWEREQIQLIKLLDVGELNKRGIQNIIFIEEASGTGVGSKTLNIINSQDKNHIKVTEWYNWMEPKKPTSPEIEFEPDDLDKRLLANIEDYAVTKGMLAGNKVDFSKPEHAIQNWHRRNGVKTSGEIELDFYLGKPKYGNSVADTFSTSKIEWIAYFKGPLIGYLKSEDKHFVAFSPLDIYSWPRELAATENKVHFKSEVERKVLTFELAGDTGKLS